MKNLILALSLIALLTTQAQAFELTIKGEPPYNPYDSCDGTVRQWMANPCAGSSDPTVTNIWGFTYENTYRPILFLWKKDCKSLGKIFCEVDPPKRRKRRASNDVNRNSNKLGW